MQGRIVIGEGERDEAPMLYIGEEVGSGTGPGLISQSIPAGTISVPTIRGSMAVLAASDRDLFNARLLHEEAGCSSGAKARWISASRH